MRLIYAIILSTCIFTTGCKCNVSIDSRKREDLSAHSALVIEIKNAIVSIPRLAHAQPSIEVIEDQGVFCATAMYDEVTIDGQGMTTTKFAFVAYGNDTKTALENLKEKLTSKNSTNSGAK